MSEQQQGPPKVVATYPYHDEAGSLVYEVLRYEPKRFCVRRPTVAGLWAWDVDGVQLVPYRLREIVSRPGQPVLIVEGEKDADSLRALGLVATTSPFGAGKWPADFGRHFRGRRCAVLPDNDPPGRQHACLVVGSLVMWGAASVRVVNLPGLSEGGDVTEWLETAVPSATPEMKKASLVHLIRAAAEYCLHTPAANHPPAREEARAA